MKAILDQAAAAGGKPFHTMTPVEARQAITALLEPFNSAPEKVAKSEKRTIPGPGGQIPVQIYTPEGKAPFPVLVYFHGGGWTVGDIASWDSFCRSLCNASGCVTVSVDYRLAPEHKFPAGVEDCLAATEWVLAHGAELRVDGSRVFVAGDSAGGTLAAVVALLLRDKGVKGLAGQILIYPVTAHYDPPTASYLENAEGYGLTRKGMMWFWDHYLNDRSEAKDFRAAPLVAASLRGLPRAFVVTAEYDVLRDEAQAYARRLEEAGVEVTHVFAEGMNHGFACSANEFPFLPQAKDVLRKVAGWVAARR
jgi:acetyl esterase